MPSTAPSYPAFELSPDQEALRQEIRDFVAEEIEPLDLRDWEWRENPHERIPWDAIEAAHERGLKDLTVPEEYGGTDASPLTLTMAAEEMAAGEMGIAVIFDQIWKIARIVDKMADEFVREEFFTEFVDDPRHLLAITLTEPANGTNYVVDYDEMQFDTTAEKDGDEWVINGLKHYISNGADAKSYVVFAQTDETVSADEGTTAFLVPHDADGLEVTHVWEKISQRLINNATVEYDDVRVHEDFVLGEVNQAKKRTAEVLKESAIEAGATTIGTARRAFEDAFEYANERVQGGQEIVDHQYIGQDFAEMAAELNAARSFLWTAARAVEAQGDDYRYELGAMSKYHASEVAFDVSKRALEKFGGKGIMFENERPMDKYLRDTLSFLHSDGTTTAHKENAISHLKDAYREGEWESYGQE
jgi:alkylation response protein AidB-like acyl-CoA dehydrogenase